MKKCIIVICRKKEDAQKDDDYLITSCFYVSVDVALVCFCLHFFFFFYMPLLYQKVKKLHTKRGKQQQKCHNVPKRTGQLGIQQPQILNTCLAGPQGPGL